MASEYVTHTPKFLVGLGLFTFGVTILGLWAWEAWDHGAARLGEQAAPERLALAGLGVALLPPGAWLMRAALRDWEARGRKRWGRYDS